ncbi:hypothetical protein PAPYR_622 [Paratrimastix pyriformis]|uniref:PSI domain-containing protein n=1 Tax=Paratrimastix pyriformis TaxID=342808 RepID=A0ABQ8UU23_9EUKA|nr:hypothetical protein PAPYR_622 [Paratrimastix pyriformis]
MNTCSFYVSPATVIPPNDHGFLLFHEVHSGTCPSFVGYPTNIQLYNNLVDPSIPFRVLLMTAAQYQVFSLNPSQRACISTYPGCNTVRLDTDGTTHPLNVAIDPDETTDPVLVVENLSPTASIYFSATSVFYYTSYVCSEYGSSCFTCTAVAGCGYCRQSATCLNGNSTGPASGACTTGWEYHSCSSTCTAYTNCGDCTSQPNCGWCGATAACTGGSSSGPASGSCAAQWRFGNATTCPTPCPSAQNCTACMNLTESVQHPTHPNPHPTHLPSRLHWDGTSGAHPTHFLSSNGRVVWFVQLWLVPGDAQLYAGYCRRAAHPPWSAWPPAIPRGATCASWSWATCPACPVNATCASCLAAPGKKITNFANWWHVGTVGICAAAAGAPPRVEALTGFTGFFPWAPRFLSHERLVREFLPRPMLRPVIVRRLHRGRQRLIYHLSRALQVMWHCPAMPNCTIPWGCTECRNVTGCAWCESPSACALVTGSCSRWAADACPACPVTSDCGLCSSTPGCGFCAVSSTCMAGIRAGPVSGTCRTGWTYGRAASCLSTTTYIVIGVSAGAGLALVVLVFFLVFCCWFRHVKNRPAKALPDLSVPPGSGQPAPAPALAPAKIPPPPGAAWVAQAQPVPAGQPAVYVV